VKEFIAKIGRFKRQTVINYGSNTDRTLIEQWNAFKDYGAGSLSARCVDGSFITPGKIGYCVYGALSRDIVIWLRIDLWRAITSIARGSQFHIHFQIVDGVTMATVLTSDCYDYTVR
jgi:hypothetical protein